MISTPHVDWFSISTILVLLGASFVALLAAVLVPRPRAAAVRRDRLVARLRRRLVTSVWLYVSSADGHAVDLARLRARPLDGARPGDPLRARARDALVGWEHIAKRNDEHMASSSRSCSPRPPGMCFFVGSCEPDGDVPLARVVLDRALRDVRDRLRPEGSLEAGLKYLIVGSFGSAALLFGCALVYGATNTSTSPASPRRSARRLSGDVLLVLGLAMIIAGLGFKSSSAPFHMWTPDVYEGAPTTVTAFMSAATKVAAFVLASGCCGRLSRRRSICGRGPSPGSPSRRS